MLNKFLVTGRMTADPEIKTIGENRLCKFTIACDRPKRKGEETAETDFFPCTAWNRNADVIVDWFGKWHYLRVRPQRKSHQENRSRPDHDLRMQLQNKRIILFGICILL